MRIFVGNVIDAIRYAFGDKKALVLISALMSITSIISKNGTVPPIYKLFTVTLLFVVGYGSYVSWHTLKGSDGHPKLENNVRRIVWEGFKKSVITFIYSGFLVILIALAEDYYSEGNLIVAAVCVILFCIVYLFLIGGLLNRYLYRGKFSEAFHFVEIFNLLSLFDLRSFLRVVVAVIISQIFAVSVIIGFSDGFSMTELIYSIASFFLAPFLYIANKRLVGLNVRELLNKNKISRHEKT